MIGKWLAKDIKILIADEPTAGVDIGAKSEIYMTIERLCEQGVIGRNDTVVSVVTGNGLKDVANAIKAAGEPISIPSDMDRLLAAFAEKGIRPE